MIYNNTIIAFYENSNEELSKESLERVLWIAPDHSEVVLINIDNKNNIQFPYFRNFSDLIFLIEEGYARTYSLEPDLRILAPKDEYLAKYQKRRDEKFAIIKDIAVREPEIYLSEFRGKLVKNAAAQSQKQVNWVYQLLKRYWFYGKSLNGLLHNYYDVGVNATRRTINQKSGPKSENGNVFVVTEEDKKIFRASIQKYHVKRGMDIRSTHKHMCEENYAEGFIRQYDEMVPVIEPSKCPTLRQFRYWYTKEFNKKQKVKAKYGAHKAEMNARALLGAPEEDLQGPGALFEIDSTPADIILMSLDHKTVIGRPHVYFVKDVMSRTIVGMHICRNPSWEEAMVALENSATDKVEFCAQNGITINEEDWPCKHLPQFLVADRGEIKSKNSNNLAHLGVRIGNPPSYRADLKPYIEQQFRGFCSRVKELLPGAVHKEHRERGDFHPGEKSVYTFESFIKVVVLFVLEFNKKALSDEFLVTKELFMDKVELTPLSIWNWGMKRSLLHEEPRDLIRYTLLPKEKCRVSRSGIAFRKMSYTCARGEEEGWFEDELIEGEAQITVSYDPRNCSTIFVRLRDGSLIQCFLTKKYKEYEGLHLDDVKIIMDFKKNQLNAARSERIQIEAGLDTVAKHLTEIETEKTKDALQGQSKNTKYKNTKFTRKSEKRVISSDKAWSAIPDSMTKDATKPKHYVAPTPLTNSMDVSETRMNKMQLFLLSKSEERRKNREQP
ncbi:hypothetical protein J2T18_004211 [Paenibacillus polymyxa]|uniref:Mu transposase C-terminal domain-containing protein n=1 Tax=Paenibacillus polymyxa TaxID=1406 RepID=UPI0027951979|nr:Mu transposase C-terminal domain-containing protein [Paenibacillus polymyxa]MDQ0049889.1 hypothetical protein [Paenibacillus polymyxa]